MLVWRKGNINKKNCLCVTVLCTIITVHKDMSSSYRLVDCTSFDLLAWFRCLSSKCLCVLHPSLYLIVSWAWWDWPLTWLTNHHPSVLWHCWLGHLTHKIVSEMTYNVSSGTLNTTIPYQRLQQITTTILTWSYQTHSLMLSLQWNRLNIKRQYA